MLFPDLPVSERTSLPKGHGASAKTLRNSRSTWWLAWGNFTYEHVTKINLTLEHDTPIQRQHSPYKHKHKIKHSRTPDLNDPIKFSAHATTWTTLFDGGYLAGSANLMKKITIKVYCSTFVTGPSRYAIIIYILRKKRHQRFKQERQEVCDTKRLTQWKCFSLRILICIFGRLKN